MLVQAANLARLQVCSSAICQPMGLRSILRQLENYAGQLAVQAEQAARWARLCVCGCS